MKIERARREKTYTLTSISGASGSGKTYSAILYARGLVGPDGKLGFIDTENKRSRFYADVGGGFDVIDMDPPFTPERYIEAIKAFEDAGYGAIVIDSVSHEWEGSGGILEQADAIELRTNKAGLHCWKAPKASHKKLMNKLLQTKAHLVLCCRVKEKVRQVKVGGKTEIVSDGEIAVQEKSFIYEMSVSLMLESGSHLPFVAKCPEDLLIAFPEGKRVSVLTGDAVRQWSEQGIEIDREFAAMKAEGVEVANDGTAALTDWWKNLGPAKQKRLEGLKEGFKSIAAARDQIEANTLEGGVDDGSDFRATLAASKARNVGERREGFNREFVGDQLGARSQPQTAEGERKGDAADLGSHPSGDPVDDLPEDSGGKGIDPDAPANQHELNIESEAGQRQADAMASQPNRDPVLQSLLTECAAKFLEIAAGKGEGKERQDAIKASIGPWKAELPNNLDDVKKIVDRVNAVVTGRMNLPAAVTMLATELGLNEADVRPAAR